MLLILFLLGLLSFLFYKHFSSSNYYWTSYKIQQINNVSLFDRVKIFSGKKTSADYDQLVYKTHRGKLWGMIEMGQPTVLVKDIELVKKVLIKDFEYFMDRRGFVRIERQKVLDKFIFNMKGKEWKKVRGALTPAFTTGKIRKMMKLFNLVSDDWISHFKEELNGKDKISVNVEKECTNYTVENIATAVFGIKSGTIRNPEAVFAQMAGRIFKTDVKAILKFLLHIFAPKVANFLRIPLFEKEPMEFFQSLLTQGLSARKEEGGMREDFFQLLIEASKENDLLTDEVITGSMLQFFFAGFSTTANFIGFTIYLLALHPEIQGKLREEVEELFKDGDDIDYDELANLPYLDMVASESLRMFPALARIERTCVKDYDSDEGWTIPKGTVVGIPVQAIHYDPEFYEFPDKFYPEHFSPENKAKRPPYAFLSFGNGPRSCIGMRFALVEGKAAIAHLVHNFIIEPTSKTPVPVAVKSVGIGVILPDNLEVAFKIAK